MTKTIVVTGATDGIGLETAKQLMISDHNVIFHGRDKKKTEKHLSFLEKKLKKVGMPVWGDLSSMEEVIKLSEQIAGLSTEVNVLINNAGVFRNRRKITKDGFEETMAVNHYAVFLLTHKLLRTIRPSMKNRIVTVSSMAHQGAKIDLKNLEFESEFSGFRAYATSKLANILFTTILARRLEKDEITANALHPGVINTKLLHAGFDIKGDSVKEGAKTSVYVATSDSIEKISGKYFINCQVSKSSKESNDLTLAQNLWDSSLEKLQAFL